MFLCFSCAGCNSQLTHPFLNFKFEKKPGFLPFSQWLPLYPCTHVQLYSSTKSLQVAPCWQGSDAHSSISERQTKWMCRKLPRCTIPLNSVTASHHFKASYLKKCLKTNLFHTGFLHIQQYSCTQRILVCLCSYRRFGMVGFHIHPPLPLNHLNQRFSTYFTALISYKSSLSVIIH